MRFHNDDSYEDPAEIEALYQQAYEMDEGLGGYQELRYSRIEKVRRHSGARHDHHDDRWTSRY